MCGHVRQIACRNNLLVASPPPARNLFRCVEAEGEGEDRDEAERNSRPHFSPHKKAYGITSFAGIRVSSGSVQYCIIVIKNTLVSSNLYRQDSHKHFLCSLSLFALCSTRCGAPTSRPPSPYLKSASVSVLSMRHRVRLSLKKRGHGHKAVLGC
jgi:hypothetical protein